MSEIYISEGNLFFFGCEYSYEMIRNGSRCEVVVAAVNCWRKIASLSYLLRAEASAEWMLASTMAAKPKQADTDHKRIGGGGH